MVKKGGRYFIILVKVASLIDFLIEFFYPKRMVWNLKQVKPQEFTFESIDETTKYGDQHPCNRLAVQRVEMSCNHKYKGPHCSNLIGQH